MKLLLSVLVAALAIALLFLWGGVSFADVLESVRSIHPGVFAASLGVQASIYVFRAVRLRGLLRAAGGELPPTPRLVAASAAWILDSHVLPAKVGEASLVVHLSRLGVKAEHGLVGLLLSRLFDLATLLAVLGIACVGMGTVGRESMPWLTTLGATLLVGTLVLTVTIVRGGDAVRAGRALLVKLGVERLSIGKRVTAFATRVEDALRAVPRGALFAATFWSLPVWAAVLGVYVILGTGVGLTEHAALGPFDLVFGSSLAILGSLVPINGFLGFGMLDMGWAWGFAAVGVAEDHAVATGLAFHTLYLVGVGILGAIGHAGIVAAKAPRASDERA